MNNPKRVLILMTEMGFGHKSAAKAIAAALQAEYKDQCVVQIANPVNDERTPSFLREAQNRYDIEIQNPELYAILYKIGDLQFTNTFVEGSLGLMLYDPVKSALDEFDPDVIVVVYPEYLPPLGAIFHRTERRIPVVTVVTDMATVRRLWFNPASDYTVVPTGTVYNLALENNLDPETLKIIGIPVYPHIVAESRPAEVIRGELGWRTDLTTILAVGSSRVRGIVEKLRGLNHANLPVQLVLVAGGSKELHEQFLETEWHIPTHIYNYVDNMPAFMRAADCIVTKAGGLIISESLSCGLPMILMDVIEGQETGNLEYVVDNGAGEHAETPLEVLEIMFHWLQNDRQLLRERAANARQLGNPRAAHQIAELVMKL